MSQPPSGARPSRPTAPFLPHGRAGGDRLDPVEAWLVALTALHLGFLPWALGTMHAWSQSVSLGLSVVGFALAAWRVRRCGAGASVWARCRGFPPFWLGAALLLYVAGQGLNPAWQYQQNGSHWWIAPVAHVAALPAGMAVPFAQAGPWRTLLVYASAWLLLLSVWLGFTRRRSWSRLLAFLVANAALLAAVGLVAQATGATRVLWFHPVGHQNFAASFIYRNHAGAYFNLVAAAALGLAWWQHRRAERRLEKSSPAGLLAFAATVLGTMVFFSASRLSIALLALLVAGLLTAFVLRRRAAGGPARPRWGLPALLAALVLFAGVGLASLSSDVVLKRFGEAFRDPAASVQGRTLAHRAAARMFADRWLFGWGAGCFRYGFPPYAMQSPEIYYSGPAQRKFWEHAHNDWIQFPAELGVAGGALLLGGLVWAARAAVRARCWRHSLALPLLAGAAATLAHATADFVLQNPAVLLTWLVLLAGAIRWAQLERPERTGPGA